ncbi:hypothetical protein A3J43_00565 [Candidatus Uhrbacteria bacterium RIFCSPHIGHO2_12_FULL_54_23]|uniref:Transmembrane protein n=3 Tax=Candidatus Uhriibacteriota TaxID=1752732 RepID=A0A1F7UHV0_9BACT|nr:MAG: hypothetical protein A3J43_00565 [Candidatus Uhrbacteria bacterium RIFCSPHIGHO2_12_FULL_54_23]OGL85261.1 MAG: hypothetical protein A3B36_00155 [Candidatus Uhrbacteria bacterium RIFCSPLOWO2_01_FULL_55_36]OGL89687.1 MAG: hypothetical protein A3J36_01300 [Candidatus Uhrbacteria bacterium RIFCSPLOWO2_02_FULL_54_37]
MLLQYHLLLIISTYNGLLPPIDNSLSLSATLMVKKISPHQTGVGANKKPVLRTRRPRKTGHLKGGEKKMDKEQKKALVVTLIATVAILTIATVCAAAIVIFNPPLWMKIALALLGGGLGALAFIKITS